MELDHNCALMTKAEFNALADSGTTLIPTKVGVTWKCYTGNKWFMGEWVSSNYLVDGEIVESSLRVYWREILVY